MHIEAWINSNNGPIDIEEAENIEIVVRNDGKTLWINTKYGCLLRICKIKGKIILEDINLHTVQYRK